MDIENSALTYRAIIYHPKQDEKHIKRQLKEIQRTFNRKIMKYSRTTKGK